MLFADSVNIRGGQLRVADRLPEYARNDAILRLIRGRLCRHRPVRSEGSVCEANNRGATIALLRKPEEIS